MAEPEIGWVAIGWVAIDTAAPALVPPGPWLAWHADAFAVPRGAERLARTDRAVQAFRHGRTVGSSSTPR